MQKGRISDSTCFKNVQVLRNKVNIANFDMLKLDGIESLISVHMQNKLHALSEVMPSKWLNMVKKTCENLA